MLNRTVSLLAVAVSLLALPTGAGTRPTATGSRMLVDDFEAGDRRAKTGSSWVAIADDLTGGSSFAELRVSTPGADSRRGLRVSGDVAAGGFAGAWVALDATGRPADVTDFDGIRLRVRGDGPVRLALRAGPMAGFNYTAPVEAKADWAHVSVPFADLKAVTQGAPALDLHTARWLGVSVGSGRSGPYRFEIDDVELYASREGAQLRVPEAPPFAVHFDLSPASEVPAGPWQVVARDAPDDGKQKRLPDATALAVCVDEGHDRVWFRITLAAAPPAGWFGANLALDVDGDPTNGMAWWGTNTAFHFDRLVSVYGFEAGSGYQGQLGIADAAEVQAGSINGTHGERVFAVRDATTPALVIGIPRSALGAGTAPIRAVAAVGSALQHNDDVPNEGAALIGR